VALASKVSGLGGGLLIVSLVVGMGQALLTATGAIKLD
jgi:hypothetical protein